MLDLTYDEMLAMQCCVWPNGEASAIVFPNFKIMSMFNLALTRLAASGAENTNFVFRKRDTLMLKNGRTIYLNTREDILRHKWRGLHLDKVIFFDHGKLYTYQYGDKAPKES